MKQFRLSRQTPTQTLTKFHVLDNANSVVGIITVANEQASDLEKHWLGGAPAPARAAASKQNPMVSAMVAAAKKHPLNRQAVLRGC